MSKKRSRPAALCLLLLALSPALAADRPDIVPRTEWKAKAPAFAMAAHKPRRILIHHTGSKQHPATSILKKMSGLQRFSQSREKLGDGRMKPAWADVPYHFYVDAAGRIAEGRAIAAVGDTNTGYDPAGYVQIVLEGNFETEKPDTAQIAALEKLVAWLLAEYAIETAAVGVHKGVAQTACPGKNLMAEMPALLKALGKK